MTKIQVILFAGFLGAGKTTLLNRLLPKLAATQKTALLVNDFGKLSLDGALLKRHRVPTREIAGGSIFCICKQANLIAQLTEIAEELHPELLLIEASGLAEPTDTAALLQNTFLRESYALAQVMTAVDAVNYPKLAGILPVIDMQIKIADAVILTKIDRADPEPVRQKLHELNPGAPILLADAERLYGELELKTMPGAAPGASLRLCATATPGFSVVNWSGNSLDRNRLNQLMREYSDTLLRAKGVIGGEHLELVNGEYVWTADAPTEHNGLFFALKGNLSKEFESKLKEIEK